MTKRNQTTRARNTINQRNDATTRVVDYNDDDIVNRDANAIETSMMIQHDDATQNQIVTLKHIIETNKIKTCPKLIRRVLRKYLAQKVNHASRDAWTFNTNQIPDVLKLIEMHCRSGKSSQQ